MPVTSDVCLVLEGTYPYIRGGVSSWVHQLACSMQHLRFSLLIILPSRDYGREVKYDLPPNIVDISEVYLQGFPIEKRRRGRVSPETLDILRNFVRRIVNDDLTAAFDLLDLMLGEDPELTAHDLLHGRECWDLLLELYNEYKLDVSFLDFFWTIRFALLPILAVLQANIPHARVYHTICTGYAGILACCALHQNPSSALLLTEHGIYAKERMIELTEANWIYEENVRTRPGKELDFFRSWWTNLFYKMSHMTYDHCDEIITLYEGNRKLQIRDGADPDKCHIIPNGMNISKYKPNETIVPPSKKEKIIISLVGRVVPIKDIKTFINACNLICAADPRIECWICGPTDEEMDYYGECLIHRGLLGLDERVIFKGMLKLIDFYPQMDILVLTSVSEAMPLVILEAFCHSIPIVSTDVGACREMLEGRTEADKMLGRSGYITGMSSPEETADAVLKIASDDQLYLDMGEAGRQRLNAYYQEDDLFANYLNLYERYL
ncbi:hypothetical protein BVY04_02020 [bacterium M21]|nr:hypothetical protein BVY04_02020 [bacterium M21]